MKVQIIMGSTSDTPVAEKAEKILKDFKVDYEIKVASAHRTPDYLKEIVQKSDAEVFIAIAGLSAALLAIEILSVKDKDLSEKMEDYRQKRREKIYKS